jgi:hypothetical protein
MLTIVSIIEYPQIKIKDPSLPVINVGGRDNPSYLPPDVCLVLPGQQSNSKLTPQQTQQMIRFAVRKPNENAQSIVTSGAQLLGFDPNNPTLVCLLVEECVFEGRILTLVERIWNQYHTKANLCSWPCSYWTGCKISRQSKC